MSELLTPALRPAYSPGPDAPADVLRAFHCHIGGVRACLPYDYAILLCHWCLADDDHRYPDSGATRGSTLKYCSERCQEAAARWREES